MSTEHHRGLEHHHFLCIRDNIIAVTGEIVGLEGTTGYLARFDVPGGAAYYRVIYQDVLDTLAFFRELGDMGDFIQDWHKHHPVTSPEPAPSVVIDVEGTDAPVVLRQEGTGPTDDSDLAFANDLLDEDTESHEALSKIVTKYDLVDMDDDPLVYPETLD